MGGGGNNIYATILLLTLQTYYMSNEHVTQAINHRIGRYSVVHSRQFRYSPSTFVPQCDISSHSLFMFIYFVFFFPSFLCVEWVWAECERQVTRRNRIIGVSWRVVECRGVSWSVVKWKQQVFFFFVSFSDNFSCQLIVDDIFWFYLYTYYKFVFHYSNIY